MSWSGIARTGAFLSVAAASVLVGGCRDLSPIAPGDGGQPTRVYGAGAVRLSLSRAPGAEPGTFVYTLRLIDPGSRVGAYQGRLSFAAADIAVRSVLAPEDAGDEFHVINAEGMDRGVIRFAALSLDGFADDRVLTVLVLPRTGAPAMPFSATLDVVSDRGGVPLTVREPAGSFAARPQFSLTSGWAGPPFIALEFDTVPARRVAPRASVAIPTIVNVDSANSFQLDSLQSRITWNVQQLTFDSIKAASVPAWRITSDASQAGSGIVSFVAADLSPLAGSNVIVTAYFTAAPDTSGTMVSLEPLAAADAQGTSFLASVRPRALALCVAPPGDWGDANGDGVVNIIDAQQVARYSVGLSVLDTTAVQIRGDVTADLAVNIIDAQQVARYSVGLSASPRTATPTYSFPPTTSITLVSSQTLAVGASAQFVARTFAGTETTGCASVTWTSSNRAVAVVNEAGLVSGIASGSATITAASNGVSVAVLVTVS